MKRKIFIIFICFLCLFNFISATTILEIQTLPNHEIFITEIDASQKEHRAIAPPLRTFSGEKGVVKIEYTSQKSPFKLGLLLKNGTKKVIGYEVLDEFFNDNEISTITFLPEGVNWKDIAPKEEIIVELNKTEIKKEENQTLENKESINLTEEKNLTKNNETEKQNLIQGFLINGYVIIQENKKPILNVATYSLGTILFIAPIYFFIKRRKNKKGLVEITPEKFPKTENNEDEIKKAEEDLKKAKERINELKGKKIEAAKKKLIEDEKELLRLKNLGKDYD